MVNKEYDLHQFDRVTLNNLTVGNSGSGCSANYIISLVGNHGVETIVVINCQDNYDNAQQISEFLALPITDFTCEKEIITENIDILIKNLIKK